MLILPEFSELPPANGLIGLVSYALGAAAFLGLTVFAATGSRRNLPPRLFLAACAITALWLALTAVQFATAQSFEPGLGVLELLRTMTWVVFLISLVTFGSGRPLTPQTRRIAAGIAAGLVLILVYEVVQPLSAEADITVTQLSRLLLVVAGFAVIENIARNTPGETMWSIKFLCLGVGGIFAYDLFFYADALLFRGENDALDRARGAVHAIVVPLLVISALRNRMWKKNLALSHKTAVYSTALVASGLYLLTMSAAAFYIRVVGGSWGPIIQAVFLFGGLVLLAVVLASGTFRAHLKVLISKHFYHYKYDYREEWMRFMNTVSGSGRPDPLETRVIQAIADPVDSPAGALWLRQTGRFAVASTWNMAAASVAAEEIAPMLAFMEEREWIFDLQQARSDQGDEQPFDLPAAFSRLQNAWILIPLNHVGTVIGLIVLARPRAPRTLDWEDFDLLRLLGRQAASYLAEQTAAGELAESRQFERFSRRTTFVMHDIKNLVSQLSLVSSNMEKHGDNPEFRKDMTVVMAEAIARMHRLMERIRADHEPRPTDTVICIRSLVAAIVAAKGSDPIQLTGTSDDGAPVSVRADDERLRAIFNHLIQNAVDASGPDGWVQVAIGREGRWAVTEITDNGPGMEQAFVQTELFRPFRSSKKTGFGIGAFQCRQYARELGGDVEVVSSPGAGTTMRVILPLADPDPAVAGEVVTAFSLEEKRAHGHA